MSTGVAPKEWWHPHTRPELPMTALHPQSRAILDGFVAAWPAVDYDTVTAEQLRGLLSGPSPFAPGDEVASIEDRTMAGPGGPLRLRLYTPRREGHAPLPVTLYFHGGGFVYGPVEGHDNVCRSLAQRARTLVVSVDYRLAPESRFPAANNDALAALEWVLEHARELGADAARVAVAGDSAGGNLATVLAHQAADRGIELKHQLLIYPVTDCRFDTVSYLAFSEGYLLSQPMMRWFWRQYLNDLALGNDPAASPLRQRRLDAMPPTTIITAGFDPLRDEGRAYALALQSAGVPTQLREWDAHIHGFVSMLGAIDAAEEAINFGAAALRSAFEKASN
jgi:acetyl esterase